MARKVRMKARERVEPAPSCGRAFRLEEVLKERRTRGGPYLEFLRAPAMSVGVYVLPAGAADSQGPHTEDEAYYVVSGRAKLRIGDEDHDAHPGTLLFVPARIEHRFHSIEEDLSVLAVFAPAEGSAQR